MTVYFAQLEDEDLVKIGYTAGNALDRIAQLQTGQPRRIKLLGTIPGGKDAEAGLHDEFSKYRVSGEWFKLPAELIEVIVLLIDQQASWFLCRASSGLINITAQVRRENEELKKKLDEKISKSSELPVWVNKEMARKHRYVQSLRAELELLREELKNRPGGSDSVIHLSSSRDWLIPALVKAN